MVLKRMLLGALGWFIVLTVFIFATRFSGVLPYAYKIMNHLYYLWSRRPLEVNFSLSNIFIASFYLPSVICASVLGVVLIEGRQSSLKVVIAGTLCWLLSFTVMVTVFILWTGDDIFYSPLFYTGKFTELSKKTFLEYSGHIYFYASFIGIPTALLGAFTYWGFRAWLSRFTTRIHSVIEKHLPFLFRKRTLAVVGVLVVFIVGVTTVMVNYARDVYLGSIDFRCATPDPVARQPLSFVVKVENKRNKPFGCHCDIRFIFQPIGEYNHAPFIEDVRRSPSLYVSPRTVKTLEEITVFCPEEGEYIVRCQIVEQYGSYKYIVVGVSSADVILKVKASTRGSSINQDD